MERGSEEVKNNGKDQRDRELCVRAKRNDLSAQVRLLLENEGMIKQLARQFEILYELDIHHYGGIELEDLIQEGRFALLEAVMDFDETADTKFTTFAYTVMRNAMSDLCRKGAASFEKQLADHGGMQMLLNEAARDDDELLPEEKIQKGDVQDPCGDEAVYRVLLQKMMNRVKLLPEREKRVIIFRYGLINQEHRTIKETAEHFHLSEKYLRVIEKKTLQILRAGMNDGTIF